MTPAEAIVERAARIDAAVRVHTICCDHDVVAALHDALDGLTREAVDNPYGHASRTLRAIHDRLVT